MNSATLKFGAKEWQLAYRVALKVLKTPDQAEDAAQDALMNAYLARDNFAGRAKPESWLYRIAYNTALSYLRRPFRRRYAPADVFKVIDERVDIGTQAPANQTPEQAAIASELARVLDDCLGSMREQDRVAFTERFVMGSTERELGELMGISTNAAKQRAFRARRAVRNRVAAELDMTAA